MKSFLILMTSIFLLSSVGFASNADVTIKDADSHFDAVKQDVVWVSYEECDFGFATKTLCGILESKVFIANKKAFGPTFHKRNSAGLKLVDVMIRGKPNSWVGET